MLGFLVLESTRLSLENFIAVVALLDHQSCMSMTFRVVHKSIESANAWHRENCYMESKEQSISLFLFYRLRRTNGGKTLRSRRVIIIYFLVDWGRCSWEAE